MELCNWESGSGLKMLGSEMDAGWVQDALESTGTCSIRRRKLPAEHVVWLVVGMALFRDRPILAVVNHLGLVCGADDEGRAQVVASAIPKARRRVGEAPLRALFQTTGRHWGHELAASCPWRGLSVYAMDGSCLSVQDTAENREAFAGPKGVKQQAGYPKLRLVTLMSTRGHIVVDAAFGPYTGKGTGEMTLSDALWDEVPDNSLLMVDRGFLSYHRFWRFQTRGEERHWLTRMKSRQQFEVVEEIGPGDYLAMLTIASGTREHHPELPEELPVRVLHYQVGDNPPQKLMTSLLDADRWPADEVIKMYHERWEIELGYRELKTQMLDRREALRSKGPESVRQEVWGILVAYNLVRRRMGYAAERVKESPNRMSFGMSLMLIKAFCVFAAWYDAPRDAQRALAQLDTDLEAALLPPRRRRPPYPRVAKPKMCSYKRRGARPFKTRRPKGPP
jgi:hypothetical protein